jgi:excisionase family DNA binding protein
VSHSQIHLQRERYSLFIHEAAAMLGVSRRTVYYRIREGKLRTVQVRGGTQRVLMDSVRQLLCGNAGRDRERPNSPPFGTDGK